MNSGTLVDVRSGRVLATEPDVVKCALYSSALLAGGGLCSADKQDVRLATTGTLDLDAVRFGEPTPRRLSVSFGGPFVNQTMSKLSFVAEPVPGSVIAYTQFQPVDGHHSKLVGLH
jgi:hypothetical protein